MSNILSSISFFSSTKKRNLEKLKEAIAGADLKLFRQCMSEELDFSGDYIAVLFLNGIAGWNEETAAEALKTMLKHPEIDVYKIKLADNSVTDVFDEILKQKLPATLQSKLLDVLISIKFRQKKTKSYQLNRLCYLACVAKIKGEVENENTYLDMVSRLAKNRWDLNLKEEKEFGSIVVAESPLFISITRNHLVLTKLLLSLGADYNAAYMQFGEMVEKGMIAATTSWDYFYQYKKNEDEKNLQLITKKLENAIQSKEEERLGLNPQDRSSKKEVSRWVDKGGDYENEALGGSANLPELK